MMEAILAALSYWVVWCLDNITGTQALSRPLVLGTVTGLFCGDMKTGIIMGATLEAIYLGAVGVGGVVPSDWRTATTVSIAYVVLTGIDIEAGLAIAVALGTLMNSFKPIINACENALHPIFMNLAQNGEYKKYRIAMYLDLFIVKAGINTVVIFLFILLGSSAIDAFIGYVPAFVFNGLNASANLLVVIGLALITRSIWSPITGVFIVAGFILAKYMGLGMIPIAALGFVIAFISYHNDLRYDELSKKLSAAESGQHQEGEDFFA
ncbi:PTS sugar transporter subunit IIC [Holdemania filiformis]|uniref:PTS sugar transporter subunit IIC n=1 Tax=Holdemania filiformis TaxID=61171 RepID=A0A412G382_9FIRM|nr:PTS sugar transporter subunit IIC [Holdemania filiformis]RGR74888.1 PTS sugar transporter subunit IIC [Holdemania filiformis]